MKTAAPLQPSIHIPKTKKKTCFIQLGQTMRRFTIKRPSFDLETLKPSGGSVAANECIACSRFKYLTSLRLHDGDSQGILTSRGVPRSVANTSKRQASVIERCPW